MEEMELEVVIMPATGNLYAAKKTVAQSLLDLALLTANASQLKHLIINYRHTALFYLNLTLIVTSLVIQVSVGVAVIFAGRLDLVAADGSPSRAANRIGNHILLFVFLLTVINVFITALPLRPESGEVMIAT